VKIADQRPELSDRRALRRLGETPNTWSRRARSRCRR
jgi:hypothetical protein